MSNGTAPTVPPLAPVTVTRNEINLDFVSNMISRGDDKGQQYLAPAVTEANIDSVVAWVDRKTAAKILGGRLKQYSQGWYFDAKAEAEDKETGLIDEAKLVEVFTKLATDFSARGESIPELKSQIDDLVESMTNLDPSDPEFGSKFQTMAAEVKDLQLAIKLQRRPSKKSEQTASK